MANGYNLWLDWEAYKICLPEARQVLEWQEQYYQRFCERPQNGGSAEKKAEVVRIMNGGK